MGSKPFVFSVSSILVAAIALKIWKLVQNGINSSLLVKSLSHTGSQVAAAAFPLGRCLPCPLVGGTVRSDNSSWIWGPIEWGDHLNGRPVELLSFQYWDTQWLLSVTKARAEKDCGSSKWGVLLPAHASLYWWSVPSWCVFRNTHICASPICDMRRDFRNLISLLRSQPIQWIISNVTAQNVNS